MTRDLIVFSHLRWNWVWQRPQHLISRIGHGRTTWFVEEPVQCAVDAPVLRTEQSGNVTRVWIDVPDQGRQHIGFEDDVLRSYAQLLPDLVGHCEDRIAWLYSPLPLDLVGALDARTVVYDVMDDLASFLHAPKELTLRHRRALRSADVVFAGGRTLHRNICSQRSDAHLFPSGVETEHYQRSTRFRLPRERPVAGYVGVIDERIDLDLVAALPAQLPDWDVVFVGPVAKIEASMLPSASNLYFPGPAQYEQLPEVMGGFDVALMPFARNDATRSISPTKTLEYLAAGLPVVSTRIDDVVADFGDVVELADDAAGFAAACRRMREEDVAVLRERVRPVLHEQHWDRIARRMVNIIASAPAHGPAAEREASA